MITMNNTIENQDNIEIKNHFKKDNFKGFNTELINQSH